MTAREVNFDGLPGLTHHYAGLSFGNEASTRHRYRVSNPQLAAKQGLKKMKALADAGYPQAVIPPQERPNVPLLRQLGFSGSDEQVVARVAQQEPDLLSAVSSASAMWVANAATVCPSADSLDGLVHLTVANLQDKFHRASEAPTTEALLQAIFPDRTRFAIHPALPASAWFGDEGAANHNRLGGEYGAPGVQLFVYGRRRGSEEAPRRYPARQTLEASQAVARLNQVNPRQLIFARQHPAAIDTGVFHNDVIAVSNRQVLFCHEQAFADQTALLQQLAQRVPGFTPLVVPASRVSVAEAVATYLFNSQLLSRADGSMALILPQEAQEHAGVWEYLNELLAGDNPIADLRVFDLRESMANGGGPACLRLRVITDEELIKLDALANQHGVPLVIDNAYGVPFPGIIFSDARPLWNPNIVLCMSLSKLGLPGSRCGIIIANEKIITAISNMNGIISLAPGGIGPAMMCEMIKRQDLLRLSETVIKPFYYQRVQETIAIIRRYLPEERCLIHKPEGAIFLWLWFKDLPISTELLYQRLKKRGVLMVPGDYFFPGLDKPWPHTHQCMRMNYVPDPQKIEAGVKILAEEVEFAWREQEA
ncbi:N-succinylarginine dihydrolase [Klebsiella pneumoniae]|nr:N-succinylarginine dihydrolase [Klebsiella pneumoniae]